MWLKLTAKGECLYDNTDVCEAARVLDARKFSDLPDTTMCADVFILLIIAGTSACTGKPQVPL